MNKDLRKLPINLYKRLIQEFSKKVAVYKLKNYIKNDICGDGEWKKEYDSVGTNFKLTDAMNEKELVELIQKVESCGQGGVTIYGSKTALAQIPNDKEDKEKGFVSMFKGIPCVELANKYDKDTNKWALENDKLFIVPSVSKPISIGFEDDTFIIDNQTSVE